MDRRAARVAGARRSAFAALAFAAALRAAAWDGEWFDGRGRLVRVALEDGWVECKGELAVAAPGWTNAAYLSGAEKLQSLVGAEGGLWSGGVRPDGAVACRLSQLARPATNGLRLTLTAEADRSNACAGLYYILHLPAAAFAGGSCVSAAGTLVLPEARARPYAIGAAAGGAIEIAGPRDTARIRLATATNVSVLVQDNRRWSDEFALLVPLHAGPLPARAAVSAGLEIGGAGSRPTPPLEVQVQAARPLQRFEGFGGNYCFGLQGGVARAVRASLRPAWARVQMRLDELRRPSGRGDPGGAFLGQLAAADRPGTELRLGLEFQALLATNRVPLFLALWRAPAWMYAGGGEPREIGNALAPDAWPRLAAAAAAYLRHARDGYGVEFETFALNEPDCGVAIQIASNDYPGVARALAAEFQRHGLRTRLALGDVSNARADARAWLEPVLADPVALRQAAWVSFHDWGGASPAEYAAWAALADRLRLPLIAAETGLDPDWRRAAVGRHDYAMAEMAQVFALLAHARPQAVLFWEQTDDPYSVVAREAGGRLATTTRWGFQKQWTACTPRGSLAVACETWGDRADACAFLHGADGGGFTLHVGNRGGARTGRVGGLPPSVTNLFAVATTRTRHAQFLGVLRPEAGELKLELPAESLVTLTTLPAGGLP